MRKTEEEAMRDAIKSMAEALDGSEYGEEFRSDVLEHAKISGIVIVFGASDDQMEFRGAIHDEATCYGGGWVYFNRSGELRSKCEYPFCPYFDAMKEKASKINAIWDAEGYSWTYETDIPHETFEVVEDGMKYCRGIVFSLDDIGPE